MVIGWMLRIDPVNRPGEQDCKPENSAVTGDAPAVCIEDRRDWRCVAEFAYAAGAPQVKRRPKSTHANSTLATDGMHVVAFFGSVGLYCYGTRGELLRATG